MHLVNRGALVWLPPLWRCLCGRHSGTACQLEYGVGASRPTCYLSERCSVSHRLRSIIRATEVFLLAFVAQPLEQSATLFCYKWQSLSGRQHRRAQKKGLPPFLKPLSIFSCLSCCASPQYSLKSFKGTSEAFVRCIRIQRVISWKTPSLLFCVGFFFFFFFILSKMRQIYTCTGVLTYANVVYAGNKGRNSFLLLQRAFVSGGKNILNLYVFVRDVGSGQRRLIIQCH